MTNFFAGYHGAAGITKMKVMKATIAMPSLAPVGDYDTRRNSIGSTWDPVFSMRIRVRLATLQMRMRRKKPRKPMMDQRRTWWTEVIVPESVKIALYMSDL
jgi:hypothetical protein